MPTAFAVMPVRRNRCQVNGPQVYPAEGEPWRASIPKSLISRLDIPQFQPGQTVHVRFDPQDRSRVGLDEYRYR